MVLTDRVITVNGDTSTLDSKVYLYRGDKNVQINLSIVNSKFRFTKKIVDNIIESTEAFYAIVRLIAPNGTQTTFPVQPIENGKAVWIIEEELINDIDELGYYNIQIRLLNAEKDSIITIPPVLGQIEVLEPIFVEGDTAILGEGEVSNTRLSPYSGVQRDTLLSDGNYNRKTWVDKEILYKEDLNTLEDISYKNRSSILNQSADLTKYKQEVSEQFNTIANKGTTVEVLERVTKEEIDRQIADGTIANLTIADGGVTETKLGNGAVTPNKTSFIKYNRINLFNKNSVTNGIWVSNNSNEQQHSSSYCSDYIEVVAGENYFIGSKSGDLGLFTSTAWAYYDKNKQQIKTSNTTWNPIPTNVKYMRICMYSSSLNSMMFVKGSNPGQYFSYDYIECELIDTNVKKAITTSTMDLLENNGGLTGNMINYSTIQMNKLDWIEKYRENILDITTIKDKVQINSQGIETAYDFTFASDFIQIIPGKILTVYPRGNTLTYYDKNKTFISQHNISTNYDSQSVIPSNAMYVKFVGSKDNLSKYYISETPYFVKNKAELNSEKIKFLNNNIGDSIANTLETYGSKIFVGNRINLYDGSKSIPGTINKTTGTLILGSGYGTSISDYIKAELSTYSLTTVANIVPHTVVLYDANKTILKVLQTTNTFTITDSNVKYFRCTVPGENGEGIIVKGEVAKPEIIPYDVLEMKFRHDKYRRDIMKDMLTTPSAQSFLLEILYPELYGKKWLCLGDSLTNMGGSSAYHAIVGKYYNMNVVNYGIVSSTIAEYPDGGGYEPMCNRYVNMDDDADIITVMGGTNDAYNYIGNPSDREGALTLYGSCHKLFKGLCNKYPGKKIGVILPPQHAKSTISDQEGTGPDVDLAKLRAKCEVIREVAHFYSLPVLDLFNEGGMNGFAETHRSLFIQGDKLHITNEGYKILARRIRHFLTTL